MAKEQRDDVGDAAVERAGDAPHQGDRVLVGGAEARHCDGAGETDGRAPRLISLARSGRCIGVRQALIALPDCEAAVTGGGGDRGKARTGTEAPAAGENGERRAKERGARGDGGDGEQGDKHLCLSC